MFDKSGSTRLYNTLMGNPNAYVAKTNSVGRYAGSGSGDNFFTKKAKSIENTLGTTGAAIIGGVNERIANKNRDDMMKDNQTRMNEVAKKYGYNTYHDVWDARDKAEAEGDQATLDFIDNTINPELQGQANENAKKLEDFSSNYKDYVQNDYIGKKINQDQGKFLGSAINTMSTATDVLGLTNGPLSNAIQGGIEGIADELEQSGFKDFSWERAGQNALTGAAAGAATGALNNTGFMKNLGQGKISQAVMGSKLGQKVLNNGVGNALRTVGTGAARGAISGAVGGATGAGLSAAMNNQDVLGSALQGAKQGAASGAGTGAVMAGANSAINKTPFMQKVNQAQQDWQNSGDSFDERLTNTLTSGDSAVGEWLQGNRQSKLLGTAGNIGNRIIMEDGKPKPFYHGSPVKGIEDFDLSKAGRNTRSGEKAIFFTDDLPTADEFSYERIPTDDMFVDNRGAKGEVYTRNLNLENPLDLGKLTDSQIDELWDYAAPIAKMDGKEKFVRNMKDFGQAGNDQLIKSQLDLNLLRESPYDGIIAKMYPGQNDVREYGVFDTNKIINPESASFRQTPTTTKTSKSSALTSSNLRNANDMVGYLKEQTGIDLSNLVEPKTSRSRTYTSIHLEDLTPSQQNIIRNVAQERGIQLGDNGGYGTAFYYNKGDGSQGAIVEQTPTTLGGWLKKAGQRVVEDANNRGVGMSVKDVSNTTETPETEVYRRLMGEQTAPKMDAWDNLAKEKGFASYDEATQRFTQANPGAEPTAENVTDWMDGNYGRKNATSVNESIAKQKLKDIKADAAEERAAKDLLNQVGTATAPAARADNMVENVKAFMKEGLTKPEEWQLVSDAITGANGTFSKLFRNLVSQAGEIDTFTGLGGKYGNNLEDTIDYYIKNAGLTGNSAKGVKNEIVGIIESLPSRAEGSLSMSDSAEDVMGAVRKLEARKRNYMGEDSRNHQNTDPYKTAKAEAIGEVASMLEGKIYEKLPDARSVVTPEAIQELKNIMPNNEKWAQSVDEKFANIKTGKDLRAVQKRYVQTSDYLTNVRKNYGTYGQKVGDAYGNALSQGLKKIPVVGGLLAQATDTPFMNRRYADINMARAAKLRGEKIDLPSNTKVKVSAGNVEPNVAMNTQTEAPNIQSEMPTNNATMTTAGAEAYNPSMNIYNAIGRNEGRDNAQQARTANYLVNAAQEAEVVNDNTGVGTTMDPRSTSLYNALYGQSGNTAQAQTTVSDTGYFQPTGDYWTDIIAGAMSDAIDANDMASFATLYGMYQDQLSNISKNTEKDYSNPVNWNSTDRKSLLQAQNGLDQIDSLESSYNNAVGSGGSNLIQGTLRQWSNNISGGNLDPSAENYVKQANSIGAGIIKNLVNLGSTEYDAQRYIDYLPKLTDTKEQAAQKLQVLRNAYENVIQNLRDVYSA